MQGFLRWLTATNTTDMRVGLGLLWLRVMVGAMMFFGHGWGKFTGFAARYETFGDPLGVGSPLSMTLTVFAEFFCSLLLIVGLGARVAAIPLLVTMLVAAGIVHADDPWGRKELAILYAVPLVTLIVTGAGRYSVDARLGRRNSS